MLRHTHILPSSGVDFDHTMFLALIKPWALRLAQEKVNRALAAKTERPLPPSCYLFIFFCVCLYKKFILLYVCVEIRRSCKTVHHRDQHCIIVRGITCLDFGCLWVLLFYNFIPILIYVILYAGRFIILSVITNIYNKRTKGPALMEFFRATGKLKKFFFWSTTAVRCVHRRWHGTHRYVIPVLATHTRQHVCIDILHCCNDPCLYVSEVTC